MGSEVRIQMLFRMISERLDDKEIDQLFDLARTDGLLSLIRNTARFNRHHDLIRALFATRRHEGSSCAKSSLNGVIGST